MHGSVGRRHPRRCRSIPAPLEAQTLHSPSQHDAFPRRMATAQSKSSESGTAVLVHKVRICLCCGFDSDSPNPCVGPKVAAVFSKFTTRPWNKYEKGQPSGRLCKLCPLAFTIASFEGYADIYAFLKAAEKDLALLNALASCVEKLVEHIVMGVVRFKDKGAGTNAIQLVRKTTVTAFRTRKKTLAGPKVELVTVEAYVEEHGVHPAKKGLKVIYEELDGKVQPCVALALGKKGHYTMKISEETGVQKTEELDDSSKALRDNQSDSAFATNAAMVEIKEDDLSYIDDLLESIDGPVKTESLKAKVEHDSGEEDADVSSEENSVGQGNFSSILSKSVAGAAGVSPAATTKAKAKTKGGAKAKNTNVKIPTCIS